MEMLAGASTESKAPLSASKQRLRRASVITAAAVANSQDEQTLRLMKSIFSADDEPQWGWEEKHNCCLIRLVMTIVFPSMIITLKILCKIWRALSHRCNDVKGTNQIDATWLLLSSGCSLALWKRALVCNGSLLPLMAHPVLQKQLVISWVSSLPCPPGTGASWHQ